LAVAVNCHHDAEPQGDRSFDTDVQLQTLEQQDSAAQSLKLARAQAHARTQALG